MIIPPKYNFRALVLTTLLIVVALPTSVFAVSEAQVDQLIRDNIKRLYDLEKTDNWESGDPAKDSQFTGRTALAVYALLSAGERPAETPKLAAAIAWLKTHPTTGIYALGLRAQVWLALAKGPDKTIRPLIRSEGLQLAEGARDKKYPDRFRGLYHYRVKDRTFDHSASQYGVLGMWAVQQAGFELPDAFWISVEKAWVKDQDRSGGWKYQQASSDRPVTLNMTAAGIATLFITQDMLRGNDGIRCRGNSINPPIDAAVKWMSEQLPDAMAHGKVDMYGLYGLERIGVASGLKYFGTVDWYQAGADRLIKQKSMWNYRGPDIGSSFGILFLEHGRAPVAINKLQYTLMDGNGKKIDTHWNQRPRDISNVVHFIGDQIERHLNWQIVNLDVNIADLHDAPVLYIGGNQPLIFSDEDKAKLKQYVEEGGLILGQADCGNSGFAGTFKRLGAELFPDAGEFRRLETDHPIYTRQQFLAQRWKSRPDLLGLSNGVRELMLLIPSTDPSKSWQLNDYRSRADSFQLMSDIFLYTTEGRDLRYKGDTYLVKADPATKTRATIDVARLMVGTNPDPEPAGWQRLANIMHNDDQVQLNVHAAPLEPGSLDGVRIAHLTGTGTLKLDEAQQHVLRDFVEGGGTLIVDAAGGNSPFGISIDDQLRATLGDKAEQLHEPLPTDHPLLAQFEYPQNRRLFRRFALKRLPSNLRSPQLRGITIDGRLAVIFSREDISGGLVGESVDGVIGYLPEASTALMRDVLLYVSGTKPLKKSGK
ncbi:DUF4159 domain-containing protein [soil metagenome]